MIDSADRERVAADAERGGAGGVEPGDDLRGGVAHQRAVVDLDEIASPADGGDQVPLEEGTLGGHRGGVGAAKGARPVAAVEAGREALDGHGLTWHHAGD